MMKYKENDSINSEELIEIIKNLSERTDLEYDLLEVFVRLGETGQIRSTHFIYFEDKFIYDEGCDGEVAKMTEKEFLKNYKKYNWIISQIPEIPND